MVRQAHHEAHHAASHRSLQCAACPELAEESLPKDRWVQRKGTLSLSKGAYYSYTASFDPTAEPKVASETEGLRTSPLKMTFVFGIHHFHGEKVVEVAEFNIKELMQMLPHYSILIGQRTCHPMGVPSGPQKSPSK